MEDLRNATLTEHVQRQMLRREISEAELRQVLWQPESVRLVRAGRLVAQGMCGAYLLRVFVDVDRVPAEVVTVYRTSQIHKYRSSS